MISAEQSVQNTKKTPNRSLNSKNYFKNDSQGLRGRLKKGKKKSIPIKSWDSSALSVFSFSETSTSTTSPSMHWGRWGNPKHRNWTRKSQRKSRGSWSRFVELSSLHTSTATTENLKLYTTFLQTPLQWWLKEFIDKDQDLQYFSVRLSLLSLQQEFFVLNWIHVSPFLSSSSSLISAHLGHKEASTAL